MNITTLLIFIAGIACAVHVNAQGDSNTKSAAEERFQIKRLYPNSLHENTRRFPDNVKGVVIGTGPATPVVTGSKVFKDVQEEIVFHTVCAADAIVIAKANGQSAFLTSGKEMIFTSTSFVISEILKPGLGLQSGSAIEVLQRGGEITDAGERLRVLDNSDDLFLTGDEYMLVLHQHKGAKLTSTLFAEQNSPRVVNGHIRTKTGKWKTLYSGASVADVGAELKRIYSLDRCVN